MDAPQRLILHRAWPCRLALWCGLFGCSNTVVQPPPRSTPPPPPRVEPRQPPTFRGVAAYEDGERARGALIAITSLPSGSEVAVVTADAEGRFEARLEPGEFALAVTAEHGFAWVEKTQVPDLDATVTLSRACRTLTGHAKGSVPGTQVSVARKSKFTGDIFIADVRADGSFSVCLPEGYYSAQLRGPVASVDTGFDLVATPASTTASNLALRGFAVDKIKQPPREVVHVAAERDGLVADILGRNPRLVGVGEATHGTAELVSSRATLTFDLIRRADVRLVLFEVDAILATALDDYVTGGDVDLGKAVAALGFWITDTVELLRFFEDLRAHNAKTRDKVHVWGIDLQDTRPPVALLLANAKPLKLTADDKSLLETIGEKRGAPVRTLAQARRAALDALLARLLKRPIKTNADLRIEVAVRSLTVQVGYFDGDMAGTYVARRDAGMADIASFLVAQMPASRACLWAHAAHVAREKIDGVTSMGEHLAAVAANRYYAIGVYVHEGSFRAWDPAGEIGVISHPIPRAPDYTVEAVVMAAARAPDIAWVPLGALPAALTSWLETPRYVRESGAVYSTEENLMTLRDVRAAFDGLVVIKSGHDTTPTPTGVRKVDK
jgi:erythromycin esterase